MPTLVFKKSGVVILLSHKINFRTKNITRDKEDHFIMIKGSIHQEDTVILSVYASNNRASKYMMQRWTELLSRNKQIHNYSQISIPLSQ